MDVAILSDMHVPGQAAGLLEAFREHVAEAEYVVHAGDFGSVDAFADVEALASDLTAVYGNADPGTIDLPAVASAAIDGTTFVVSHGMINVVERAVSSSEGVVFDRADWLDAVADTARARAEKPVVGIGGHSHAVEDTTHEGVRILNPGSATGVGPADGPTMMTVDVAESNLEVTVREA
ncbi:YfcE family phosphodiesterase [Halobacteriales archaeon QS_3_64_16]|nr:MAG: YfcE family phosphodiesterase [Halobacteriales archaeon QS_3_64_16]